MIGIAVLTEDTRAALHRTRTAVRRDERRLKKLGWRGEAVTANSIFSH